MDFSAFDLPNNGISREVMFSVYHARARTVLLRYRVVRVDRCGSGTCGMNEVHVYVPCKLETSRSLQAARPPCSLQTARPPFQRTTCTCVPWRDNFKENREKCHDFIVLYCVKLGGHFGSRESSSSQQPFIPCEQTCHCFPQLQARKRIITIVKKTGYFPLG